MIRGCGTREENALYLEIPTSPFGQPIEYFLIDPPIPWKGGQLRSPMIIEDRRGIKHLVMGVGKMFYPYVPDIVMEIVFAGLSKRLPRDFDPAVLTPGESKLLLVHPNAIPKFNYSCEYPCPKNKEHVNCIGHLWPLSAVGINSKKHQIEITDEVDGETRRRLGKGIIINRFIGKYLDEWINSKIAIITIPTGKYCSNLPTKYPETKNQGYNAGIFIWAPIWRFVWVNRRKKVPKEIKKRFEKTDFELTVAKE